MVIRQQRQQPLKDARKAWDQAATANCCLYFKKEDNMKSARINFGIPESEYILEVDDSGAATSLVNQDTGTEYVGGGDTFILF